MPSTTSCVGSGTCSTSSGFSWHAQEQKIRRKQHSPPCHHPPLQPPCHRRHQSYGQRPRDRPCLGKIATVSGALGALRGASRHQRDDAGCGRRQPPPPRQRSAATTKPSVARPCRSGSRASGTVNSNSAARTLGGRSRPECGSCTPRSAQAPAMWPSMWCAGSRCLLCCAGAGSWSVGRTAALLERAASKRTWQAYRARCDFTQVTPGP